MKKGLFFFSGRCLLAFFSLILAKAGFGEPWISWVNNLEGVRNPYHIVGSSQYGSAMSLDGRVVVGATKRALDDVYLNEKEAFIAYQGIALGLGTPSTLYHDILNIQVCGDGKTVYGQFLGGANHPFRWTLESGFEILDYLVVACSADGNIVAYYRNAESGISLYDRRNELEILIDKQIPLAFASLEIAGLSADGSTLVGNILDEGHNIIAAFLWSSEEGLSLIDLFEDEQTEIKAISGDGQTIIGAAQLRLDDYYQATGFIWQRDASEVIRLDTAGNIEYFDPKYVNFDGSVVVGEHLLSGNFRILNEPFIWTRKQGHRLFEQFLQQEYSIALQGKKLDSIKGISANGKTIAGAMLDYGPYDDFQGWLLHLEGSKTNLAIRPDTSWGSFELGEERELEVKIVNQSQQAASQVELIVLLADFLKATAVTSEQGECRLVHQGIHCHIPSISGFHEFNLQIATQALAPGRGKAQMLISSAEVDSDTTDNRHSLNVEVKGSPSYVTIIAPSPSQPLNERQEIYFKAEAQGFLGTELAPSVQWTIASKGSYQVIQASGEEVALYLAAENYTVIATAVDEAGRRLHSERVHLQVQRVHDIQLAVSKEESGFLFFKKRKTKIQWSGAMGAVDIYQEKSCDGGSGIWFQPIACLPFQKVATGESAGQMEFEYSQNDRFMVCEAGTDISQAGFEASCSLPVKQVQ